MSEANAAKQISKENGEYKFVVLGKPASLQSSPSVKQDYKKSIQNAVKGCNNTFFREVEIKIVWLSSMKERYTTDATPDTDNIIKPTLDALTGSEGLIFDDCQIQSVICHWIDKNPEDEDRLEITLRTLDGTGNDVIDKNNVAFFQYDGPIYYLFRVLKKDVSKFVHKNYQAMFANVEEAKSMNILDGEAENLWPLGAIKFHISRISNKGYPCIRKENIQAYLDSLPE